MLFEYEVEYLIQTELESYADERNHCTLGISLRATARDAIK